MTSSDTSPAIEEEEPAPPSILFSDLSLPAEIIQAVDKAGYTHPTAIQANAIPVILDGQDLIGASQTGTGKTAAFALPILANLNKHGALRCLVLEPTRELAAQVNEHFENLGEFTNLRSTLIHGGVGYGRQTEDLRNGVDTVVATPGRLLDHIGRGNLSLDKISVIVLDEVDRMLDMGFLPDVRKILNKCPKNRQTLFFSATMPPAIQGFADWALRENPAEIEIGQRRSVPDTVNHAFYPVASDQRDDLIVALLQRTNFESVMVFTRTKKEADTLTREIKKDHPYSVTTLHSDIPQRDRTKALQGFREGRYQVIIATDLAARGLDISGVTHVFNYRVPENAEDYVHRIGRTGRAQSEGDAFTILSADELPFAESIERFIGKKIERRKLDDFPYLYTTLLEDAPARKKKKAPPRLRRRRR
ncbi:MAG: DEAD/DEAH box helicase [Verrucomicrobiota bacterium]